MDKKTVSCKYCHKQVEVHLNASDKFICNGCKGARIRWYILFSFLYCFLYSSLTVILSYAGIGLGAIPTMIIFGAVLYLIRVSSEAMTERRYYREVKRAKKAEQKTETISKTQQENHHKLALAKYCKKCGGKIDEDTRKCTKCGKQYFKPINLTPKFCKVCGGAVDKNTGKCKKCGKQYLKYTKIAFKPSEKATLIIGIITILVLCVFLCFMLSNFN